MLISIFRRTMLANALLRHAVRRFPGVLSQVINKNPAVFLGSLSVGSAKPLGVQHLSSNNQMLIAKPNGSITRRSSTQISDTPPSFARRYYIERVVTFFSLPLLPAAYFIHSPIMDYALALAVGLHIHWGFEGVAEDYGRPFVIGETLAKLLHYFVYVFSAFMFAGLLHFNYNDVGITKAFEMIWSL